jgi:uncharacterized protein (TIGR03067 family)
MNFYKSDMIPRGTQIHCLEATVTREMKALQGTWTIVSLELDGQKMEGSPSGQVVVKGDRFTTTSMGATYDGVVEVNANQKPKHFDLVFREGPEKGNTNRGIYELQAETWRICLNTTGGKRPSEFATSPGSGLALETLRRGAAASPENPPPSKAKQAKGPAAPKVPAPEGDEAPELAGEWAMGSCVMDGRPLEVEFLSYGKRVASATEVTVTMGPQVMLRAAYRVDRSASPCRMNYMLAHGPHKGKAQYGIYRLEGGTLQTCFAAPGRDRPADFSSTTGDGRTFTVWKLGGK